MIRTIAMIILSLAMMAAVQMRLETRLGLHCAIPDANSDLRIGLRS